MYYYLSSIAYQRSEVEETKRTVDRKFGCSDLIASLSIRSLAAYWILYLEPFFSKMLDLQKIGQMKNLLSVVVVLGAILLYALYKVSLENYQFPQALLPGPSMIATADFS